MAGVSSLCMFKFALQENQKSVWKPKACLKFFVVHAPISLKIIVSNKLPFLEHVFVLQDESVQIKVHENVVYGFISKTDSFCCSFQNKEKCLFREHPF